MPRILPFALGLAGVCFAPGYAQAQTDTDTDTEIDVTIEQDTPPPDTARVEVETNTSSASVKTELDVDDQPTVEINQYQTPPPDPNAQASAVPTDRSTDVDVYVVDREPRRYSGIGMMGGGGVNEFAGDNLDSITDAGGSWTARILFGTRSPLALEAAYIGTANPIATLGLDRATLMSNGAEGALRLNIAQVPLNVSETVLFQPYVTAGFAWKHYNIQGAAFNTSSVQDSDDVFEVPLGAGLGMAVDRFLIDARFDYRPSIDSDLIADINDDNNDSGAQTWTVSGRVGVEF